MKYFALLLSLSFSITAISYIHSQNTPIPAERVEFTYANTMEFQDTTFGAGYTFYAAVWPLLRMYPGQWEVQSGLVSTWMNAQPTGNEPPGFFYSDIEGGLGWWHDTRFGKKTPKFIMGGVAHNFSAWSNGVGAGSCSIRPDGHRDWSEPGGLYGVAQLSPNLLWPPDGLNMKQGSNGELLGYGYMPLPLTEVMETTWGVDVTTGNQSWTLFLNTTNFKGPATFFLPTHWSKASVEDPTLEGLFLDTRPSNPNISFGIETATTPAVVSFDENQNLYAHVLQSTYPVSGANKSVLTRNINVYSKAALWNSMQAWFEGGPAVEPGFIEAGVEPKPFSNVNNGAWFFGEIKSNEINVDCPIDFETYVQGFNANGNTMGFEWNPDHITHLNNNFYSPEYYKLFVNEDDSTWKPVAKETVPEITGLLNNTFEPVPGEHISYLTPMEPDCHWQDPNGPWKNPGPSSGPFQAELGDGSILTYYWYKFNEQPSIVQANLPEEQLNLLQERAELIHSHWTYQDEYLAPPVSGELASVDPGLIVTPPPGMEIGYVPVVTRQEKAPPKIKVFILAGQSNMEGQGKIYPASTTGTLSHFLDNDPNGEFDFLRDENDEFIPREDVWVRYDRTSGGLKNGDLNVGYGAGDELIGPEYGFGYQIGEFIDDQVLIIKTAWGGKNLAVDFRPPSSGGETGPYFEQILEDVEFAIENIQNEFPEYDGEEIEITGFGWFQGWNDAAEPEFLEEYATNMTNFIHDIREDLEAPDMQFVIALAGHGGFEDSYDLWVQDLQHIIVPAQFNAAYHFTVDDAAVAETRPFWRDPEVSPSDMIHHWHENGESFLRIGDEMGKKMIRLLEGNYDPEVNKAGVPLCSGDGVWINGIWENEPGEFGEIFTDMSGYDSLVNILTLLDVEINTDVNVEEYTLVAVMGEPNYEGVTYQWLNCENGFNPVLGETSQSYLPFSNGTYAVEISYLGCTDTSDCYTINLPDQVISASVFPENSGTISGTGIYTYGHTAELTATPEEGLDFINWTEYGIEVSTDANYSFVVTQDRTLIANFDIASKTDAPAASMFSVSPNPSSGSFVVKFDDPITHVTIEIFNISGKKVWKQDAITDEVFVDCSYLDDGIYLIRCVSDEHVFQTKFLISKE